MVKSKESEYGNKTVAIVNHVFVLGSKVFIIQSVGQQWRLSDTLQEYKL